MTSTFNNIYIKDKTFFLEDLVEFYDIQNSLLSLIFGRRRLKYVNIMVEDQGSYTTHN